MTEKKDPASKGMSYKDAGVDIDRAMGALAKAKGDIQSTFTPGVMHEHGAFGGMFSLDAAGVGHGLLVASTDGVGTKVRLAARMQIHNTVGQDLVNHCVDDILVQGAKPLFFLDYMGTGKIEAPVLSGLIEGLTIACRENGMALLGGETAEMPGVYQEGDFDLVGTIVGSVPAERVITGKKTVPGDVLLALPSTGLHTNGYSLAQKIVFEVGGLSPDDMVDGLDGLSVGEALLAIHKSYLPAIDPLLDKFNIHGMAHITGGGLIDNLPRVLPDGCLARVETGRIKPPGIFKILTEMGGVSREESYRVFNMGFGFILILARKDADAIVADLESRGEEVYRCGEIVAGEGGVELCH